jgi:hypothetical protein
MTNISRQQNEKQKTASVVQQQKTKLSSECTVPEVPYKRDTVILSERASKRFSVWG